jgi:chromosome segregation ATPase
VVLLRKQAKEVLTRPAPIAFTLPETKRPDNIRAVKEELEKIREQLQDVSDKRKAVEKERDEAREKLSACEPRKAQLEIEVEKQRNEIASLGLVHGQTIAEIKSLRNALSAKCDSRPERQSRKSTKKLKAKIQELEETTKGQARSIHDLECEKQAEKQRVEDQALKVRSLTSELTDIERKLEVTTSDLETTRQQLNSNPPLAVDDLIPPSAWRCSEFDAVLSQQIERVASNPILQPPSKLGQIYRLIARYYRGQIRDKEAVVQSITTKYEQMKLVVNQFSINVSSALSLNVIALDDFVEKGGADRLFQQITKTLQTLDETTRCVHEYQGLSEHVSSLFGDSPDLFARMTELRGHIDGQTIQLKSKRTKNHALRVQLRALTSDRDHRLQELISQNVYLTESAEESQRNVDEASQRVRQVKKEFNTAKHQLKELEGTVAESEANYMEALDRLNRDNDRLQNQLNDHIEKSKADLFSASQTIAANKVSIAKLQQLVHSQERTIREKMDEIAALEQTTAAQLSRITCQCKTEKERLIQPYESALSEMQQQCDAYRNDIEKTTQELACLEQRNQRVQRKLMALKQDKQELQREVETLKEIMQRNSEVAAAVGKSAELAAQVSLSQKLQDAYGSFENEKRRLFSLAADEFRTYFNAADSLDESTYRQLLAKVKTEIKRLTESEFVIRRLVGAAADQLTDDAVAQLLT